MIGIWLLLMIPTMPTYFLQFTFGSVNPLIKIIDFSVEHRLFLYLAFIIPLVLYFLLRNKNEYIIRFSLIFISCGVLIGFLVGFYFNSFKEPWTWPIHLCNTALFIIPLCLIFKLKRLFYFTYFINVLGALLAMALPNYNASTNLFDPGLIRFWYNHWAAFFMPLLIVSLKVFNKPKIKEFYYSMIWFSVYFIVALVCNVLFTAMGHEVDFFVINSDFIANKLGDWAENLFKYSFTIKLFGYDLVFRPLYQIIFFIVYIALGLAEWFVYSEIYRISDSHYQLHVKLKIIKQQKLEYLNNLTNDQMEGMMNNQHEIKLELKHFSKKYASNKHYSVKDASLEVYGGEIFGFLGPNGAGKSTIIKSMVGIQPLTEGQIEICGYDIAKEPTKAKYNIGYVPDHYALYEKLTGREYINYIADIFNVSEEVRNERIKKYITIFQLEHAIDNKISTYSHGMKQKITIMSALVHNPKVWILDEPLTGLDPNSIFQVKECMRIHASEGNIVFFSSHLIDIVEKLCQRVAIIRKGQILCIKTLQEIEATGLSLEEFYMQIIEGKEQEQIPVQEVLS
jgi:ABC-2 type transport system ATP-binding protein